MKKSIALLLILSACATPTKWSKPGAPTGQFAADKSACMYEMHKAQAGNSNQMISIVNTNSMFTECLEQKGWHQVGG